MGQDTQSNEKEENLGTSVKVLRLQKKCVCKVDFTNKTGSGSGFYAKWKEYTGIMTNHHVFKSVEEVLNRVAIFNYHKGEKEFKINFDPKKFFWSSKKLDASFCAIKDDENKLKSIKPVDLEDIRKSSKAGDNVHIYQHPEGRAMEKSSATIQSVRERYIWYLCDTQPGSSGSPVFLGSRIVGLHHAARVIVDKNGKTTGKKVNEAIKIGIVIEGFRTQHVLKKVREDEGLEDKDTDKKEEVEPDELKEEVSETVLNDTDSKEKDQLKYAKQKSAICKITFNWGIFIKTGFYAEFKGHKGIMTTNYALKEKEQCTDATASFIQGEEVTEVKLQPKSFFWSDEELGTTFVGCDLKELEKITPLVVDECYEPKEKDSIHVNTYDFLNKITRMTQVINLVGKPQHYNFSFYSNMQTTTGAPIFRKMDFVGIHHLSTPVRSQTIYNQCISAERIRVKLDKYLEKSILESNVMEQELNNLNTEDKIMIDSLAKKNRGHQLIAEKLKLHVEVVKQYLIGKKTNVNNESSSGTLKKILIKDILLAILNDEKKVNEYTTKLSENDYVYYEDLQKLKDPAKIEEKLSAAGFLFFHKKQFKKCLMEPFGKTSNEVCQELEKNNINVDNKPKVTEGSEITPTEWDNINKSSQPQE